MLKCVDAIHLTIEAVRRSEVPNDLVAETLDVWDSAFRAADTLAGVDELEGAMRVIFESCRTLTDALSTALAAAP